MLHVSGTRTNITCDVNKSESVQRKAVHFICYRYDHNFSPSSAMTSLKLPLLSTRRDTDSLKLLHSFLHSSCRLSSDDYISYADTLSTRRYHSLNLKPFFTHTNIFKNSFFPRVIEMWNDLPGSIRELSLSEFVDALL